MYEMARYELTWVRLDQHLLLTPVLVLGITRFAVLFMVSVVGHLGRLVFGSLDGVDVVIMQGRIHAYEGHSMWQVHRQLESFVYITHSISVLLSSCKL